MSVLSLVTRLLCVTYASSGGILIRFTPAYWVAKNIFVGHFWGKMWGKNIQSHAISSSTIFCIHNQTEKIDNSTETNRAPWIPLKYWYLLHCRSTGDNFQYSGRIPTRAVFLYWIVVFLMFSYRCKLDYINACNFFISVFLCCCVVVFEYRCVAVFKH